jgi:hypothetical protein
MDELAAENERLREAIRRLADQDATLSVCDGNVTVQIDAAEWIPVSERLPPLLTEVLGWHSADRVRAWFRHSGTVQGGPRKGVYWESWTPQDRECDDCNVDAPTHWMPLPSPPEVK